MTIRFGRLIGALACLLGTATAAAAPDRPPPVIEAVVGSAGFIDSPWIHRTMLGAGARVYVSPRIAIGPEFVYLASDTEGEHDLTLTGNLTFDLTRSNDTRRIVPYLAIGGGLLRQTEIVGSGPGSTTLRSFTSSEGTISGGIGARIGLGRHFFVAPEFRMGWEPETRFCVTIGFRPGG
jgi:hypothetical protein